MQGLAQQIDDANCGAIWSRVHAYSERYVPFAEMILRDVRSFDGDRSFFPAELRGWEPAW